MKITPVTGPGAIKDLSTPEHVRTARAVNAFKAASPQPPPAQAQETPVQNPNAIAVEELGAIKAQTVETVDNNTDIVETTEATEQTTTTPEKPKEDPALSRQFAQLARQERALRAKAQQQEQALQVREQALKAKEEQLAAKDTQYRDGYISRDRLKQDALSVLDEAGVSYDELTQQIISRQPTDPRVTATISKLEAKIAQLEANNEASQTSFKEQQQANYQAAVKQIKQDAVNLVKSNPQEYEAIAKKGTVKDVVELIERTFQKDGTVLSVEEAAQAVENELIEEALKYQELTKIKQRMTKASATSTSSIQKTQAQQTQTPMKTLTNATSSTRPLTVRERAIAAMEGRLKA